MIYLIYGCDQEVLVNKEIKKSLKECMGEINEFNVNTYSFPDTDLQSIIDDCATIPFMMDNKAVIVKNATFLQEKSKDLDYLINASKTFYNAHLVTSDDAYFRR